MRLSPYTIERDDGNLYPGWKIADGELLPDRQLDTEVLASLDDETRRLDGRVVRMMFLFSEAPIERAKLRHDCGVFALACWNNNDLRDVDFSTENIVNISPSTLRLHRDDPNASARTTYVLSRSVISPGYIYRPHLIVKANTDKGIPLYASKLDVDGDVVLSTFDVMRDVFASTQVSGVSVLRALPTKK